MYLGNCIIGLFILSMESKGHIGMDVVYKLV